MGRWCRHCCYMQRSRQSKSGQMVELKVGGHGGKRRLAVARDRDERSQLRLSDRGGRNRN